MNRKNYQGFISKNFVFSSVKINRKTELDKDLYKFIVVKVQWFPSGYRIMAAWEVTEESERFFEDWPFRHTSNDIYRISEILEEE